MRNATDDLLLRACYRFLDAQDEMTRWGNDGNAPDCEGAAISEIWYRELELVTALQPLTTEGALAKAGVGILALESLEPSPIAHEEQAALAALRGVVALAHALMEESR